MWGSVGRCGGMNVAGWVGRGGNELEVLHDGNFFY